MFDIFWLDSKNCGNTFRNFYKNFRLIPKNGFWQSIPIHTLVALELCWWGTRWCSQSISWSLSSVGELFLADDKRDNGLLACTPSPLTYLMVGVQRGWQRSLPSSCWYWPACPRWRGWWDPGRSSAWTEVEQDDQSRAGTSGWSRWSTCYGWTRTGWRHGDGHTGRQRCKWRCIPLPRGYQWNLKGEKEEKKSY